MKVAVERNNEAVRIWFFSFKPYHPAKALLVSENECQWNAKSRDNEGPEHTEKLPYICITRSPIISWYVVLVNNVIPS